MKITLRSTKFSTVFKRLRNSLFVVAILALASKAQAQEPSPLLTVTFHAESGGVPLSMALPGLFTTVFPVPEGNQFELRAEAHTDGFLYILYEQPDGTIEVIRLKTFFRRKGSVRKGETLRFPQQSDRFFRTDSTGNRDGIALLFSSSPQKRRMLTRAVNSQSGSFSNKVQSVLQNDGVTLRPEEQLIVLGDHKASAFQAVLVISIDKR